MAKIYTHFSDKSLVLDSSENLMYPLLGSLLKWDNLRVGFAISVTQSATDDNAALIENEVLPMSGGYPLLNKICFGLKTKTTALVGESGCNFIGIANGVGSMGSSVGMYEGSPLISHSSDYPYEVKLSSAGAPYLISGAPISASLSSAFSNSGTTFVGPELAEVSFSGIITQLNASLTNGQTSVSLNSSVPIYLQADNLRGIIRGDSIVPSINLGTHIDTSGQYSNFSSYSQGITLPAPLAMQGSAGYASIVVLDYSILNRGNLATQSVKVGMKVFTNQTNTSPLAIEALMATYSPTVETSYMAFPSVMPTAFFIRWPFNNTRLRVHSLSIKKF